MNEHEPELRLMQGNEAVVEGAIAAGCRFFAGYPITPASEIAELMARRLPEVGGTFIQMEDEIASISTVIGAVWGGAKACTASSGPGISLMQEGIGYAAETETPCVIINVMRGGPSTGQPTLASQQDIYQAKYGSHGDYEIIALTPSNAQEAYDLTIEAFNLAERYRVPVYVLMDEVVGHTREKVRLHDDIPVYERVAPPKDRPPFAPGEDGLLVGMPAFNQGYRLLVDGQLHDEWGIRVGNDPAKSAALVERLCRKITDHIDDLTDLELLGPEDARVALVTFGSSARSSLEAAYLAEQEGIPVRVVRLRTIFPFPEEAVRRAVGSAETVLVPEMNIGKLVLEVRRAMAGAAEVRSLTRLGGPMPDPAEILQTIKEATA